MEIQKMAIIENQVPEDHITEDQWNQVIKLLRGKKNSRAKIAAEVGISPSQVNFVAREWMYAGKKVEAKFTTPKMESPENKTWEDYQKQFASFKVEQLGQKEVTITIEQDRPINLVGFWDPHVGSMFSDTPKFMEDVEEVAGVPNTLVYFGGDLIDNFDKRGHGGGVYEQIMSIKDARTFIRRVLDKLGEQTLWMINGNHEEWSFIADGFDPTQYFSNHITGYWGGFNIIVNMVFPSWSQRIFATHKPPSNSYINPTIGLRRAFNTQADFDIGVAGHYHHPSYCTDIIREKSVLLVSGGSYKHRDRYSSYNNWGDSPSLMPGLILDPCEQCVIPFLDFHNAMDYL